MISRRNFFQISGAAALVGAGGAAWMYLSGHRFNSASAAPIRPYPFDPIRPENFQQKLFIPGGSGAFGVMDVAGPLQIRATAASFPILNGQASPFLLYQTEQAGKAYQNPILRMESGSRFQATLNNALPEPTIIHWHGLHTPANMDGHPVNTISPGGRFEIGRAHV